jgi:hypothetical protein
MPEANDQKAGQSSENNGPESVPTNGDVPNLGPTSDPADRDFGDSAGYGSGGSTRDYQEVVGENPVTAGRPNPLDAVIPPETHGNKDENERNEESGSV